MQSIIEKLDNLLKNIFWDEFEWNLEMVNSEFGTEDKVVLTLAEENMGKVIGRGGESARTLREMIYLHNKLFDTNYALEIRNDEE